MPLFPPASTASGTVSGTTGKLAKFTSSTAVGDSILSESGSTATVAGSLTLTGGTLNCAAIIITGDAVLLRTAANTLALRNSTNAQTFDLFGTFGDTSNYRRLRSTMSTGGAVTIASEGLGTGATGNTFDFQTDGSSRLTISASGSVLIASTGIFGASSRGRIAWPADAQILLQNSGQTDVDYFLKLGMNTVGAAGIKRVGTVLQARLNDDSAFATIQGKLRADNAYVAGVVTDTGTITITDSTGTAYRVLCAV